MTALTVIEHAAVANATRREVLTLRLGTEEYGIDILAVQEIRRYEAATRIANAPPHMLGVVDLRGVIVPILDLRWRLGLPVENGLSTVTIVVTVAGRTVGLVADSVYDVAALDNSQIRPRPNLGGQADAEIVVELASIDQPGGRRMVQLMDLDALLRDL